VLPHLPDPQVMVESPAFARGDAPNQLAFSRAATDPVRVLFAVPCDVVCSQCGSAVQRGTSCDATKRVHSRSSSTGCITRVYEVECANCGATERFTSSEPGKYAVGSPAVTRTSFGEQVNTERQDVLSESRTPRGVARSQKRRRSMQGYARVCQRANLEARSVDADAGIPSRFRALMQSRAAFYADIPRSAALLEEAHRRKWNDTPLRRVSQRVMEEHAVSRDRARASSTAPSNRARAQHRAKRRTRTGRMEPAKYRAARAAVKSLSRGGAFRSLQQGFASTLRPTS
jgi:hypothetical protein